MGLPITRRSRDVLVGIVPGQTLRMNLFSPISAGRSQTVGARVTILAEDGTLIAQDTLVIPPGDVRSFDWDHTAVPLPGEPGPDRLQLRAHVESMPLPLTPGEHASCSCVVHGVD
jgi:hypothetical protein